MNIYRFNVLSLNFTKISLLKASIVGFSIKNAFIDAKGLSKNNPNHPVILEAISILGQLPNEYPHRAVLLMGILKCYCNTAATI